MQCSSLNFASILCSLLQVPIIEKSPKSIYSQQFAYLLNITSTLNNMDNFDNLILYRTPNNISYPSLMQSYVDHTEGDEEEAAFVFESALSSRFSIPLMTFTINPWDYVNNTAAIPNLGYILTNKNLALVILDDIFNKELKEFVALSLGASLETKIVFLLEGHELTDVPSFIRLEKMRDFFRWCWAKNILYALLVFQKDGVQDSKDHLLLEVYTYTPFPKPIELIRLTNVDPENYFDVKTSNLMGYQFKTPVLPDRPMVFKLNSPKSNVEEITGTAGRLYLEFVHKMNGTFTEITPSKDYNNDTLAYVSQLLDERKIDVAIHPYTFLLPSSYFGSYPITHSNICLVVPVIPEINRGYYIPLTFNSIIWNFLLLTFLLFMLLQILSSYRRQGRLELIRSFTNTMRGMLNLPPDNHRANLTNILLMFTGMIFTSLFVACLTSLLGTTIYGQQLETVEDLRAHNITIMLHDYHAYVYFYLDLFPENFTSNLLIADSDTISKHQDVLNTSYGYIVYQEEWKLMAHLQSNLWKPIFKIANQLCVPNVYLALPLQFNSPFYQPLKIFIMWTQSSGLEYKWSDMVFSEIQHQSGQLSRVETREHPVSLTNRHLIVMWIVWFGGIILASVVFSLEMLHSKIAGMTKKQSKSKRIQKKTRGWIQ